MLSAASSYDLTASLTEQQSPTVDHGGFGSSVATSGNLALIGAAGVGTSFDNNGNPVTGSAELIDTSNGTLVRHFADAGPGTVGDAFGKTVAFVNGKIAISSQEGYAGGRGQVYIYDTASDTTPTAIETPSADNDDSDFARQMVGVGNDLYVSILDFSGPGTAGVIAKFDSTTGTLEHLYTAPDTIGEDSFGAIMVAQGTNIYATASGPNGPTVYKLDTTTGTVSTFTDANAGDPTFGYALAATASDVYVSAPGSNTIYEFDNTGAATGRAFTAPANSGSAFGGFGSTLTATDDGALVAANDQAFDTNTFLPNGEAYVIDLGTGNVTTTITNPTPMDPNAPEATAPDQGDQFGWALAPLTGGKFIVTDPTDDTPTSTDGPYDTGTAYVFAPHSSTPVNQPPTAAIAAPASTPENSTVTLSAAGSTDPDGPSDITMYQWDLNNDGKFDDATGVTANFSEDLPGNYPVAVQVTDSAGHTSVASATIQVTDIAPTANAGGNQTASEGTGVTLHGSGNNASGDAIVSYKWDLDNNGTFETTGQNPTFNPDLPGTYTVKLQVTDDDGQTATDSAVITITDVAPTANAGGNQTGSEGTGVTLHGSGTTAPGDLIVTYAWDLDNNGTFETTGQNPTFNPDLPGTYTVNFKVTDDDGESATNSATITITDVAPTANAGGNQTGSEGTGVTLHGAGTTAPGDSIVTYAWDLDNNGTFETTGQNPTFNPDLPGTYTVNFKVTDDDGESATNSATITITDVAPTANAGPSKTATTGATVNFSGSGTTAPGDSIVSYAWDFNYGGNPANFNATGSGANTSHAYASAGTYTVALRVTDDDGETAISTTTVTVSNPPPVNHAPANATITGQSAAVRLQTIQFHGSYTDQDAGDTHQVTWNFGDGNTIAYHPDTDAGALAPTHAYANAGTYTVTMTVKDQGGLTATANFVVNVTATGVQGGTLYVGGTGGSDSVIITQNGNTISVVMGGNTTTYTGGHIVVYGGAGNDIIGVAANVSASIEAHGGDGNDLISGGAGNDILVGDGGDDLLVGNGGRDMLIGGTGSDILIGGAGDEILIAGSTSHDNDSASLNAIMAIWTGNQSYTARVNQLKNGLLAPDTAVYDDGAVDLLSGGTGTDVFYVNTDAGVKDIILDASGNEQVIDLDFIPPSS